MNAILAKQSERTARAQRRAEDAKRKQTVIARLQRAFAAVDWNGDLPERYILNCHRPDGDTERGRLASEVSEIFRVAVIEICSAYAGARAALGQDLLDRIFADGQSGDHDARERMNDIREMVLDVVQSEKPQEKASQASDVFRSLIFGEWDARRHFHSFFERGACLLADASQRVARGETALAPQRPQAPIVGASGEVPGPVATAPRQTPRRPRGGGRRRVTDRQSQIFSVYTRLGSYTATARELSLHESTVRAACAAVADKTGAALPMRMRSRRMPRDRRAQIAVTDRQDECDRA